MPTYCFSNESGKTIEKFYRMSEELPSEIIEVELDESGLAHAVIYLRDYCAERKALQTESSPGWPMPPCVSSGVDPSQAQELRDLLKKSGVPTEVTRNGDPIYRSPAHQKRALAARGMYNKASY